MNHGRSTKTHESKGTGTERDYRQLYSDKEKECKELSNRCSELNKRCVQLQGHCAQLGGQFNELQEQTNQIINDLESDLKEAKRKNEILSREIAELKEKRKFFNSSVEREIDIAQKERNEFKKKFIEFEKKVIELQIVNESLESQLRATKAVLTDYECRTQKTMEQLAALQVQLEEATESNAEQTARLKAHLKETEEEIYALHHMKHKKERQGAREEPLGKTCDLSLTATVDIAHANTAARFREALKEIRDYMSTIDANRVQIRKRFLKNR